MSIELGIRTDGTTPPPLPGDRRSGSSGFPWWFWVLMPFGALMLLCCFSGFLFGPSRNSTPIEVGREYRIASDPLKQFPIAVDYGARDELLKAERAGDDAGMLDLINAGRVFLVNSGTKVLVLERYIETSEIRVVEGEHAGRKGVIINEWLFP